jgi:hypothetical protein
MILALTIRSEVFRNESLKAIQNRTLRHFYVQGYSVLALAKDPVYDVDAVRSKEPVSLLILSEHV